MKKNLLFTVLLSLALLPGGAPRVLAEILPPEGEGQIGLHADILCETLTLREAPSASSRALRTLHYGDFVLVMEQSDGWAYCALGDAEDSGTGYLNADYLAIDPARYRAETSTPVYAWKDTQAKKVALLSRNTTLPILKEEGEWLVVSLRGAAGWIRK